MKNIVIIYHGNCQDGFGGAWAAWKKFGDKAEYLPVKPGAMPEAVIENKEVYFIDTTPKIEEIKKLIDKNKRVTVIDHHITGEEAAKLTVEPSFAIKNSGCVLAWKYFHPQKPVPKLLEYLEDNDLWRFKIPKSKEVFSFMCSVEFTFKIRSSIAAILEKPKGRREIIEKGAALLKYEQKLVNEITTKDAEQAEFKGYKILIINSPFFQSNIGHVLSKIQPPMGLIWHETDGKIKVSLRSDGTVDVSKIAAQFGGGGHKAAAGFSFSADDPKPWKLIRE